MEYKGYVYEPHKETEYDAEGVPENVDTYHFVRTPEGETALMDWPGEKTPTPEEFQMWVDLGMPSRFSVRNAGGPLTSDELKTLYNRLKSH